MILHKGTTPKVAVLKVRCATVNTVVWQCGELTKIKDSSLRVVLKESPNPPLKLVEAVSSSLTSKEPAIIMLKDAPNVTRRERVTEILRATTAPTIASRTLHRDLCGGPRPTSRHARRAVATSNKRHKV